MPFFVEHNRRNVIRVALVYVGGSWLILQVGGAVAIGSLPTLMPVQIPTRVAIEQAWRAGNEGQ